jgi:hypothetical protein
MGRRELVSEGVKVYGFGNDKVLGIAKDLLKNYSYVNIHWSLKEGCGEWSEEYEVFFYDFCSQSFWEDATYDNLEAMLKSLEEVKHKDGLDPDSLCLKGHWRMEEKDLKTLEDMWSLPSYTQEDIMEISLLIDLYEGATGEKQKEVYDKACELFEHAKDNY